MYLLTVYEHDQDPRTYEISTKRAEARAKARLATQDLNGFAVLYGSQPYSTLCEVYEGSTVAATDNQLKRAA